MNWEEELIKLYDNPVFDDVKPVKMVTTSTDRLITSFEEINNFYEIHNRLPDGDGNTNEKCLARRFESIICDASKIERCLPYDRFGLVKTKEIDVNAELKAIFDNPIFEITKESQAIFDVPEHLKKDVDKSAPDFVAQRVKCENFDDFDQGFKAIHQELSNGNRTLIRFQEAHLSEGNYFLIGGVVVLLNKILNKKKDRSGKYDGRTHCVFENGTESNMLLRSLSKAAYLHGYTIQGSKKIDNNFLVERFTPNEQDVLTGYIYVLKSKSLNPVITQYQDLYKIGFTTTSVEERIANAKQETTYLLDDVEIVATWKTYNLNVVYFENMLHKLFDEVQLHVKIHHQSGAVIVPHEWFVVPLAIIRKSIEYIRQGIPISYNCKEKVLVEFKTKKHISEIDTSKLKILILNIKSVYFEEILKGYKTEEYRKIKKTTINKYTYINPSDGKRWLRKYDAIKFYVGYHRDSDSALIEVTNIEIDKDSDNIVYHLGRIIETNIIHR